MLITDCDDYTSFASEQLLYSIFIYLSQYFPNFFINILCFNMCVLTFQVDSHSESVIHMKRPWEILET